MGSRTRGVVGPGRRSRLAGCEAIVDDLEARRCAASLEISTTGTLGVILRARKAGLVPEARPVLQALLQQGLYLAPSLVVDALDLVGESPDDD
ncbi:MAG: DUF3368 domain-containing protein [Acidobacteria bacterium]|nr:MAG: DUF3368 domain-containing protein [Acidobacteriota bacterium]REK11063.1 MAG: DUF3368 domain-containing protein [Acidobacteriota bacterium]